MGFKKMQAGKYPPRMWAMLGYPDSGKSTFAAQMRGPMLVVDSDHRFTEVLHLSKDVYQLSENAEDNVDTDRIAALLAANMPGSDIRTIIVDTLTSIVTPMVVKAIADKEAGREKNLMSAFKSKAMAMRQLQDAVTRWGTDVLWIYHKHDARDAKANETTRASIPATELIRLTRSLNAQLEIVTMDAQPPNLHTGDWTPGKRGIKVLWSRTGREGMTIWDDSKTWNGMPERIEAAMYDGLTEDDKQKKSVAAPEFFPSPEIAVAWAMEQGAFDDIQHARNAYDKIKREMNPQNARAMASCWVADVQSRLFDQQKAKETV